MELITKQTGEGLIFLVLMFLAIGAAKLLSHWRLRHVYSASHEIVEHSHLAIGLRQAGMFLGIGIGMIGTIGGPSKGSMLLDVQAVAIDAVIVLVFMMIARFVNDRIITPTIDNDMAIREGNVAVALTEFGSYIATGLVMYGAMSGAGGVISAVVFFVLGQASLVVIARSYEKIVRFPIIELINRRNNSAGLLLAMTLIAYGLLVSRSISGSFTGWTADLTDFGFSMLTGFALIALLQWPLERIFLTNSDLKTEVVRDDNVAGVLVITTVRLALFAAVAFVAV